MHRTGPHTIPHHSAAHLIAGIRGECRVRRSELAGRARRHGQRALEFVHKVGEQVLLRGEVQLHVVVSELSRRPCAPRLQHGQSRHATLRKRSHWHCQGTIRLDQVLLPRARFCMR